MKILTFDTTTQSISVALGVNDVTTAYYALAPRQHNDLLLPAIDRLLGDANLTLRDLDAISFTHGPGGFTGVRLGLSVAQGLALASQLPIIPISTLQCLAQAAYQEHGAHDVIAALDARMGEVYYGAYQVKGGIMQAQQADDLSRPEYLSLAQWQDHAGIGSGFDSYPEALNLPRIYRDQHPNAKYLLAIAGQKLQSNDVLGIENVQAVYLRNQVAQKKT